MLQQGRRELWSFKSPCVCVGTIKLNVTKRQTNKASQSPGVLVTEGRVLATYPVTNSTGTDPQTSWYLGAEGWTQVPLGSTQHRPAMKPRPSPSVIGSQLRSL